MCRILFESTEKHGLGREGKGQIVVLVKCGKWVCQHLLPEKEMHCQQYFIQIIFIMSYKQ